jgi:exopolyphosphatase/guanosine-5'-triphosphate,3'-diphosphate pyrophosphatase
MEEARYSALGVVSGFFRPVGLVGDMGGGSLEVAEALDDHVGDHWTSLPLGALPVEALLQDGVSEAKRRIDKLLRDNLRPSLGRPVFYAVGGGWRTLAKVHMAMERVPVPVVHGYTCNTRAIRDFAKYLVRLPSAKLAGLPGPARAAGRTTAAAALVLDRLLKRLQPERVVFSALGLREGWLYSQLTDAE